MSDQPAPPGLDAKASHGRRILRNFASMTTGKLAGDVSTLVLLAAISRVYGEEGLGVYSLAMAISGFLAVTSNFGLTQLSVKELSRQQQVSAHFGRFLAARTVLVVATIILLLALVPAAQWARQLGMALLLIGSSQVLFSVGEGFTALMIAREEMHLAAAMELALRFITMAAVCIGAVAHWPLTLVLGVFPLTNLVFAVCAAGVAFKRYGMPQGSDLRPWRATLRSVIPYGTAELLEQYAARIDILMVGTLLGTTAAGAFNAGFRILFSLNFVPAFAARSIFPLVSRLHGSQPEVVRVLLSRALARAILIAMPAAVGLWLIAPPVIQLIFGDGFERSATVLRVLVVLLPLNAMIQFLVMYLMATDRQPICTRLQWQTALLNTAGNAALIPMIGLTGAAISTVVAKAILMVLLITRLAGEMDTRHILSRLLIAMTGAGVIVACAVTVDVHFLLFIPLAAVLHVATICAFPTIRKREVAEILALWQRSGARTGRP